MHLYDNVPITQCWARSGKAPVASRWLDRNKGDARRPNFRSRYVAKGLNRGMRGIDLFAATPPLEGLRAVLAAVALRQQDGHKLFVADISRAFFYAPATREVYVALPPEDVEEGEEELCGLLRYSLYGTRDAAQNWQRHVGVVMAKLGFTPGVSNPCLFRHDKWDMGCFVHGDDFVANGSPEALSWFKQALLVNSN